jgi:hypothetical protein
MLIACEYLGPSYQDHSKRQLEIINAASFLVPSELRARTGRAVINEKLFRLLSRVQVVANQKEKAEWPKWKKFVARIGRAIFHRDESKFDFGVVHISPKRHLLRVDPSECVRSSELIRLLKSILVIWKFVHLVVVFCNMLWTHAFTITLIIQIQLMFRLSKPYVN